MPRMQRLAIALTVVAVLVAAPAAEAAKLPRAPRGFYGVMWDRSALRGSEEEQDAQWAFMRSSRVQSVRTVFSWAQIAPTAAGPDDYTEPDRQVAAAARHGLRLLPVVLYTPQWARRYPSRQSSPPESARRLRVVHGTARRALRAERQLLVRPPRAALPPDPRVADLERAALRLLLGDAQRGQLGAAVRLSAPPGEALDPHDRPPRQDRARRVRRRELEGAGKRLQGRCARGVRRRGDQHLHRPARLRDGRRAANAARPPAPPQPAQADLGDRDHLPGSQGQGAAAGARLAAPLVHDPDRHGEAAHRALRARAEERPPRSG